MNDKVKMLSLLIENKNEGLSKTCFKKIRNFENLLNELMKNGSIKTKKVGRWERYFITDQGEIEFIKEMSKDEFQEFLKQKFNELHDEIKKLNENFENLMKILSIKSETKLEIEEKIDLPNEIYKTYKELSTKDFSFMAGLVPIPSIVANLIQKYNLKVEEIHKVIYELYLKGEILLEYGDKKEGNLITPEGKSFYYIKFKK
ncbi:MAG: hypothetical protein QXP60_07915 [Nitrososphaerota archaeon]